MAKWVQKLLIASEWSTVHWKGYPDMFFTQQLCFYLIFCYNNYKKYWIMLYNKEKTSLVWSGMLSFFPIHSSDHLFYGLEDHDYNSTE